MERKQPGASLHFVNCFLIFLLNFLHPLFKMRLVLAVINSELLKCNMRFFYQFSNACCCLSRVCLHLHSRFAWMPACTLARWRRPAASRRAFHVLDGAVRKHRLIPRLWGWQGMPSFITDEKKETWEAFWSRMAERSAETKVLLNIQKLTLWVSHWVTAWRHREPAGVRHANPPQEHPLGSARCVTVGILQRSNPTEGRKKVFVF